MDILRVLTSPDMEVKRKALAIALDLVSSRNVEEVVLFLKKELVKTLDAQFEKVCSLLDRLSQALYAEIKNDRIPNYDNY